MHGLRFRTSWDVSPPSYPCTVSLPKRWAMIPFRELTLRPSGSLETHTHRRTEEEVSVLRVDGRSVSSPCKFCGSYRTHTGPWRVYTESLRPIVTGSFWGVFPPGVSSEWTRVVRTETCRTCQLFRKGVGSESEAIQSGKERYTCFLRSGGKSVVSKLDITK